MKAHDAGDVFAQIIATLAAGFAVTAGLRTVCNDAIADLVGGDVAADSNDLTSGLDADDQRQLALSESHAAPAPDVDVIKPNGLDADLHVARGRRRWGSDIEQFDLAVADQRQRAHGRAQRRCGAIACECVGSVAHAGSRVMTRQTFWPPKPNE